MTQELNKDGLEAACSAYEAASGGLAIADEFCVAGAVKAYLNHTKVTGFDDEIAELCKRTQDDSLKFFIGGGDFAGQLLIEWMVLANKLQSALAAKDAEIAELRGLLGEAQKHLEISKDMLKLSVAQNTALRELPGEALDAILWCSASQDFQPGGQAEYGWDKLCRPLIAKLTAALTKGADYADKA